MLDFDGTVVEHAYPKIGRCNFGCMEVIKKLQDAGHEIFLNTYRVEANNGSFEAAQKLLNEEYWMCLKDIGLRETFEMKPITKYTTQKVNPPMYDWNYFKTCGTIYIDDICTGTPLKKTVIQVGGLMVDWDILDKHFIENEVY